jgi:hypothetical protein
MARFYASIQGNRGEATRMGTPNSGISAHVRGWNIGAHVQVDDEDGEDVVFVRATGGSNHRSIPDITLEFKRHETGVLLARYRDSASPEDYDGKTWRVLKC